MTMSEAPVLSLRDGRRVQIASYGDPSGVPALWFHGAFSSRKEAGFLDVAARDLGLRVLGLDRPGVGGSDPFVGARTAGGYADDVAEVLDLLELEQAVVGGLSNGGMFAAAIGSWLPERVVRVVPLNASTPVCDARALASLSLKGRMSYRYMKRSREKIVASLQAAKPPGRIGTVISRYTSPDARLYADPVVAGAWGANLEEARRQPDSGYLQAEIDLATSPWDFDHRAIPVPVTVMSGDQDAGLGYAKVWATELPQGRLVVVPGGHGNIVAPAVSRRIVEVLLGRV